MSASYVVGILALLKEAYPMASNKQLRSLLEKNALDLGIPGKNEIFGCGLVQAIRPELVTIPPRAPSKVKLYKNIEIGVLISDNEIKSVFPTNKQTHLRSE